jgi:hypothetical protein
VATRVSTGDADVNEAAELMINLFWRGLKGRPSDTGGQERSDSGIDNGSADSAPTDPAAAAG